MFKRKFCFIFLVLALFLFSAFLNVAPTATETISAGVEVTPDFLGNPLAAGTFMSGRYMNDHFFARSVWDMQLFDNKIYCGSGDYDTNQGPIDLYYYDLGTTNFGSDLIVTQAGTTETSADEEEINNFKIIDGVLWTTGMDSHVGDWNWGNIYRYDNNDVWTKFRTIPNGVHVFDILSFNGKIYASIGTGDTVTATVYESSDGGLTFTPIYGAFPNWVSMGFNRIYDLFEFNNDLYASFSLVGNSNLLHTTIYKFNGSSFEKHLVTGLDLVPGAAVLNYQMGKPTNFNGNLVFFLHLYYSGGTSLYKTSDLEHGTLINLGDGINVNDILVEGETIYVLGTKWIGDNSFTNYIFSSTDLINWNEVIHFSYPTYVVSFEKNNGDFYFGAGTGFAGYGTGYGIGSSANSGDILKVGREEYLAITPVIESINGVTGVAMTGPTTAVITLSNLDVGSSITVLDNSVVIGSKLVVGTTDTITVSDLSQGIHPLIVRATNINGNSTANSIGVTYTVITTPGIPTGVGATAGDRQVTLNWTAPTDDGGVSIIDYQIEYTNTGIGWTEIFTAISTGTTKVITGLINNQKNLFRIRARNSIGLGSTSATVSAISVGETGVTTLIDNNVFVIPVGESSTSTSQITVNSSVNINIGDSGILSKVQLGEDTIITEISDQDFNANLITGASLDKNSVSNLSNYTAKSLIQWGIPGVTLKFDKPITIKIHVGSDYDGQTLSVFRSLSVSSGWTTDGLVSSTCLVADGVCSFSTNQASYFTASTYSASITNSSDNNSSSTNSSSSNSVCTDLKPLFKSDLFQINTTKSSAKLFFTPLVDTSDFYISFSQNSNAEEHGEQVTLIREGVQSHTIYQLKPNIVYYVKVRGQNGCMPGDWSNIMKFRTDSKIYYKNSAISNKITSTIKKITNNLINKPTPTLTPTLAPIPVMQTIQNKEPKPTATPKPTIISTTPEAKKKCFLWWCW